MLKNILHLSFIFLAVLNISKVQAQADYPNKPIRMIVGFPAGGSTDIVGRIVAQKLGERLGQSIIVDNRGGAGGTIGADLASKASPDGYNISIGTIARRFAIINAITKGAL